MLILYLALLLLVVSSLRYNVNGYNEDYLAFGTTNAVKGIFILLFFISHVVPYIVDAGYVYDGIMGDLFWRVHSWVGQWIVAMFLFYSGYGIMESIKKKGEDYVALIPRRRILTVLLNFDISVLVYVILAWSLANEMSIGKILLSFVGWESVGNSNWYIFVIILAYLITYVSFVCFKNKRISTYTVCSLLFLAMLVLSVFKGTYWYDTILCFGAGLLYSQHKVVAESFARKHYVLSLTIVLIACVLFYNVPYWIRGLRYNMFCIAFCLLNVLLSMKFRINSNLLIWFGKNLFPLYIYQRLPMILLSSVAGGYFVLHYPMSYAIVCFAITILITLLYKYWAIKL